MPGRKKRYKAHSEDYKQAAIEDYLNGDDAYDVVAPRHSIATTTLQRWVALHRAAHPEDER